MAYAFLNGGIAFTVENLPSGELGALIDKSITEIEISDTVEEIGDYAFYGCESLERVVMPAALENIGAHAFLGCGSCLGYDFTKCRGIPYFDETAFEGMNENAKIYVSGEQYNSWINTERWYSYKDRIEAVGNIPEREASEGLTYTYKNGGYTLTGPGTCEDITVLVPATYDDGVHGEAAVVAVAESAFKQNDKIKEITFKSTVDVGGWAFYYSSLVRIENIRKIGEYAFAYCNSLRYARFTEGTVLGAAAWNNSPSDDIVGTIYDFRDCVTVAELQRNDGVNHYGDAHMVVPDNLYDEWIVATNWTYHTKYIIRSSDAIAQGIVK